MMFRCMHMLQLLILESKDIEKETEIFKEKNLPIAIVSVLERDDDVSISISFVVESNMIEVLEISVE